MGFRDRERNWGFWGPFGANGSFVFRGKAPKCHIFGGGFGSFLLKLAIFGNSWKNLMGFFWGGGERGNLWGLEGKNQQKKNGRFFNISLWVLGVLSAKMGDFGVKIGKTTSDFGGKRGNPTGAGRKKQPPKNGTKWAIFKGKSPRIARFPAGSPLPLSESSDFWRGVAQKGVFLGGKKGSRNMVSRRTRQQTKESKSMARSGSA